MNMALKANLFANVYVQLGKQLSGDFFKKTFKF